MRRCSTVSAPILGEESAASLEKFADSPFQQLFPFRSLQSHDDGIDEIVSDATGICFSVLKSLRRSDFRSSEGGKGPYCLVS